VEKLAQRVSDSGMISSSFVRSMVGQWMKEPESTLELNHLTDSYEITHACHWLSFRLTEHFVDVEEVTRLCKDIAGLIGQCLKEKKVLDNGSAAEVQGHQYS